MRGIIDLYIVSVKHYIASMSPIRQCGTQWIAVYDALHRARYALFFILDPNGGAVKLRNFVCGTWSEGTGDGDSLGDPVLGSELARVSSGGIDFEAALGCARKVGGPALRRLTFASRAALLSRIADQLATNREVYYRISLENSGSPRSDAAIDVDGAIYTLRYYAKEGAALGASPFLTDGGLTRLGKDESFQSLHIALPLRGVAILINAFNFPSWGLWEKAAPALLSGVPILVKPASATAWLAHKMVEDIVNAGFLPEGALSLVCGSSRNLLNAITEADAIAFTGSAATAASIRAHPAVAYRSARVNIEADSLNVALLGPDVGAADPELDLLAAEVVREMTVKAGQKCTAIRRILVPFEHCDRLVEAIRARLATLVVGDPRDTETQMGPLVSKGQQRAVLDGISELAAECTVAYGCDPSFRPQGVADLARAAFVQPTLLIHDRPLEARAVHEREVFGPVATILPSRDLEDAFQIARLGRGSLVASIFTSDPAVGSAAALDLGSSHGRVHIVSAEVARSQTGHGNVMPMSLHGGPGRAGGGHELGGLRALRFYHQPSAVQGPTAWLTALSDGAARLPA
jgi:3,4-dehydroadipyl-CoA semialdehyde dehydrogenase